jgi:hypothetical protein
MNAVDIANQFRAHTTFQHKFERRNWRPLGFFLFDICLGNSFFIWRARQAHQSTHLRAQFNRKLIDSLLARGTEHTICKRLVKRRCAWGASHLDECSPKPQHHVIKLQQPRQSRSGTVRVPLGEISGNSRQEGLRRRAARSIWGCDSCNVNLCIEKGCFVKFHKQLYDNLLWNSL